MIDLLEISSKISKNVPFFFEISAWASRTKEKTSSAVTASDSNRAAFGSYLLFLVIRNNTGVEWFDGPLHYHFAIQQYLTAWMTDFVGRFGLEPNSARLQGAALTTIASYPSQHFVDPTGFEPAVKPACKAGAFPFSHGPIFATLRVHRRS